MLPQSYRSFRQNRPLFFYCVLCGALYLLGILGWALLWRLQFIREALAQMEQIHDEMARNEAYHWLGGFFFLFSLAFAGIFAFAFVVLDLRILGPRPRSNVKLHKKSKAELGGGALIFFLLAGRMNGVWANMLFGPIVVFLFALAVFLLRLRLRCLPENSEAAEPPAIDAPD